MKRIFILCMVVLSLCACERKVDPDTPVPEEKPMPSGTEGSTYVFSTIGYDGLLATDNDDNVADKTDSDIYWEAEADDDGTFKNTIKIVYDGSDAVVSMSKSAGKVFMAQKQGAHIVILPSGGEVKKCEIILSGQSDDGSLKIYCTTNPDDKEAGKKVKLTLNGLNLKSKRGPAINYQAGKRMYLHLSDGTVNSLEDAAVYSDDIYYFAGKKSADEDRKGCFFSEKAVVVSGKGKLTVKGNCKHAISVDNSLYMRPGPTVVVTGAAKNCLNSNDVVRINGGYLYAVNTSDGGKGIETDGALIIDGGRLVVNTSGAYGYDGDDTVSPKGIKVDGDIIISGGDITVRSVGKCEGSEGIDSKSAISVKGGKINILSYDDAISGSASVTFAGGEIYCLSTDGDGIDSKGSILIKGGKVTSVAADMESGSGSDKQGIAGTVQIDGGEVIGIGGAVSSPASGSKQCSIIYKGCPMSITEELAVKGETGNKILSITSPQGSKSAAAIFSSPELVKGGKYVITIGTTTYQTVTLTGNVTVTGTL